MKKFFYILIFIPFLFSGCKLFNYFSYPDRSFGPDSICWGYFSNNTRSNYWVVSMGFRIKFLYLRFKLPFNTSIGRKCSDAIIAGQRGKASSCVYNYCSFNIWRNLGFLGIAFCRTYRNFFESCLSIMAYKGQLTYFYNEFSTSST